jgi:hypothetical protein
MISLVGLQRTENLRALPIQTDSTTRILKCTVHWAQLLYALCMDFLCVGAMLRAGSTHAIEDRKAAAYAKVG